MYYYPFRIDYVLSNIYIFGRYLSNISVFSNPLCKCWVSEEKSVRNLNGKSRIDSTENQGLTILIAKDYIHSYNDICINAVD